MPPESDKTYTVTWKSSRQGVETGSIRVDDKVLVKGKPQAGFSEDQVNRLKESFKGKHVFSAQEDDTTDDNKSSDDEADDNVAETQGTPGAGGESRGLSGPPTLPRR